MSGKVLIDRMVKIPGRWILLAAGLLLMAGCEEGGVPQRSTPPFNHKIHVVDEEMECVACHKAALSGDKAGMPVFTVCSKCHEGIDKDKPVEKHAAQFLKNGEPVWSKYTTLHQDVKFSHKKHADYKVACADCHGKVGESTAVKRDVRVPLDGCVSCHAKKEVLQVSNNCSGCHLTLNKEQKPASHQDNWKEIHGTMAGFESKDAHGSCQQCHTETSCTACHRDQLPKNHNNHFRRMGHGIYAQMDRTTCMVCHNEHSCDNCHRSVSPQSHKGNFASRHCVSCHFPLADNSCFFCHKNEPSHRAAPNTPTNNIHQNATADDCRDCHGGLNRPHIDNGDSCLECHRR